MARIPAAWLKTSWEAATLGGWFAGLLQRHDQLAKWLAMGRPRAYWLTGFFNPQVGGRIRFASVSRVPLVGLGRANWGVFMLLYNQSRSCQPSPYNHLPTNTPPTQNNNPRASSPR